MKEAAARIADAAGKITNDEVAAIVPSLQAMFAEAGEVMEAVASGDVSKVDDLAQLGTTFQETSEAFQEICTTLTTALAAITACRICDASVACRCLPLTGRPVPLSDVFAAGGCKA